MLISDQQGFQARGRGNTHPTWWLCPHWGACRGLLQVNNWATIDANTPKACAADYSKDFLPTGSCCGTTVRIIRVRWWSATSCWRFTWGSSPPRSSSSTADSWQANCGSLRAIRCCRLTSTLELCHNTHSCQILKKRLSSFYLLCLHVCEFQNA